MTWFASAAQRELRRLKIEELEWQIDQRIRRATSDEEVRRLEDELEALDRERGRLS